MAIKSVFKCHLPSAQYIFKKGANAIFVAGRFETNNPEQIAELMEEVQNNHPHIYTDPKELTVDSDLQEKIRKAQAEAVSRVLAESKATIDAVNASGVEILSAPVVAQLATTAASVASLDNLIVGSGSAAMTVQTSANIAPAAAGQ